MVRNPRRVSLADAGQATLEAPRQTDLPATGADVLLRFPRDRLMAFAPDTGARVTLREAAPARLGETAGAMR